MSAHGFQSIKLIPVEFKCSIRDSRKSYRLIELKNGILTLLVSDPLEDIAGGALCVSSGSFNDPNHLIGLAHLCEHAIFLGNKQNPEPQSFFKLINNYNGNSNAYTTGESTCFQYEVPITSRLVNGESIYGGILSNFASMFHDPLLNELLCTKEISAVNDEHLANKASIVKVLYYGLRLLSNKNHPFSRFGTGDSSTLATSHLSKHLSSYFHENYKAEKMTLVLKGPQSLNQLQKNAIQYFSLIPRTRAKSVYSPKIPPSPRNRFGQGSFPLEISSPSDVKNSIHLLRDSNKKSNENRHEFPEAFTGFQRLLHIENDHETIYRIFFSYKGNIPNIDFYERVWCAILGDESEGSLGEFLISKRKLAANVMSQVLNITSQDRVLAIDIHPTNTGKKCGLEMVRIVLNYITNTLCVHSDELSRYLWDIHQILKLNFQYQSSDLFPMDEAALLAERLHANFNELGLENLIKGFRTVDDSDFENLLTRDFVLTTKYVSSHFNLIYVGNLKPNLEEMTSFPLTTKVRDEFFKFQYTIYQSQKIEKAVSIPTVPSPNIFIQSVLAENENLFDHYDPTFQTKKISTTQNPILIDFSKHHEIWFKREHDVDFDSRVITNFSIECLPLNTCVKTDMAMYILCDILGDLTRTKFYSAELLGYQWAIYANLNGVLSMSLLFLGLRFRYIAILSALIEEMITFLGLELISYRQFLDTRVLIRQGLEAMKSSMGIAQAYKGSLMFLEESFWTLQERLDALELLELDDVYIVAKRMLQEMKYTRILVSGDCDLEFCNKVCYQINKISNHEAMYNSGIVLKEPQSHLIKSGKNYVYETSSTSSNDPMNTVFYYIQIGPRSDSMSRVMTQLLASLFSTSANSELRGKKMIGYAVLSAMRISRSMVGACIVLMSGTHKPADVLDEIQSYVFELELKLMKMSESEFKLQVLGSYKAVINEQNAQMPANYFFTTPPCKSSSNFATDLESSSTHHRIWENIFNKTYTFNGSKESEIDALKVNEMTKERFLEYFREKISIKSPKRSTLLIFINSSLSEKLKVLELKSQILAQLEQSNMVIPDAVLEQIIIESKFDTTKIMDRISKHFMDKSSLKFIYKPLKFVKNRKRRSMLDMEVSRMIESRKSAAKILGHEYLDSRAIAGVTVIHSVDEFRAECLSTTETSLYKKLSDIYDANMSEDDEDDTMSWISLYANM